MAKRLWLIFAQAVTVFLAGYFVISTLKPGWLGNSARPVQSVTVAESSPNQDVSPGSYHEAVKKSMPAVVNVFSSKNEKLTPSKPNTNPHQRPKPKGKPTPENQEEWFNFFFGDPQGGPTQDEPEFNTGSGVLISKEGLILTNHHVIEGADKIEIALGDGRKTIAKLIGSDPETDIAVLKIDLPDLPEPIVLGNLSNVNVGDVVLAIGNPFGVGQTVTAGIVSALGRDHLGINTFENFIQTDAAINPGNSGGGLVDTKGQLIGINTAIFSKSGGSMGIGFAIPVNLAKQVMESIVTNGAVTRGWMGVEPRDLSPEIIEAFKLPKDAKGVLISGILKNGPAELGGIKPGDILKEVNDEPIKDVRSLLNTVAALTPGSNTKVVVDRKGQSVVLSVAIGKRPSQKEARK
ncbi:MULTISPECIES: trypsin-like peptidase domain-containing protein [unclassified Polynucleobacter]|uniref:S1C family serine protease n=1 Tax=unclassified Polynucleobacter TaxID=2640945 RepID=UPI00248F8362|nr:MULTISPECIES: trypsin-like peptidase domain-containing protein [unclassified Polynucleobacter]